jgi:hypothetical protein
MLDAVILTVISLMLFVAFLKQRKKPRFKLPATICVLSSAIGTSLAWLAYVVDMYQKETFYLNLKLRTLGGIFILFPFILFGDWFVYYMLDIFKRKPHEQRILFHIGKIGIRFIDIIRVIILIPYGYYFFRILLMKEL